MVLQYLLCPLNIRYYRYNVDEDNTQLVSIVYLQPHTVSREPAGHAILF